MIKEGGKVMLIPFENHQQRRPRLSCQGTANQKALRDDARGMLDKTLIGKSAVMQELKEILECVKELYQFCKTLTGHY